LIKSSNAINKLDVDQFQMWIYKYNTLILVNGYYGSLSKKQLPK
jgi:hypothetical protein